MSPRWLFFPAPAAAGYRQDVTYTMNGSGGVSAASSTGDAIIYDVAYTWPPFFWLNDSAANSAPRFRMGSYTSGFTSGQVASLIATLKFEYSINGGAVSTLGDPITISSNQTWYINASQSFNNSSAFVNNDTIRILISDS